MTNSLGNLTGELPQLDSVEDLSEQLHIDIRLLYLISNDTATVMLVKYENMSIANHVMNPSLKQTLIDEMRDLRQYTV